MSSRALSIAESPSTPLSGFRNKIINGNFDIWQRGNNIDIPAGSYAYTSDRWLVLNQTDQTATVAQSTLSDGDRATVNQEVEHGLQVSFSTAPTTGDVYIIHRIENVRTLSGLDTTLAAYFASNIAGMGITQCYLSQNCGSGGSTSASTVFTLSGTLSNAYSRFDGRCVLPSLSGKTVGDSSYLGLNIQITPRATGSFWVTHVSLVEGDATSEADPFSPRHPAQELALCQRYYTKGSIAYIGGQGWKYAASGGSGYYAGTCTFPSTMRLLPTISTNSTVYNGCSDIQISIDNQNLVARITLPTGGGSYQVSGNWEADAEI